MIAVDASVVVAGMVADHPAHVPARAVLARRPVLPAHAAVEAYAVLTRLPPPLRQREVVAAELLRRNFGSRIISLGGREVLGFLERMADGGVSGGAIHDALIAETARRAGASLVTNDGRASVTYRVVGVAVEPLET